MSGHRDGWRRVVQLAVGAGLIGILAVAWHFTRPDHAGSGNARGPDRGPGVIQGRQGNYWVTGDVELAKADWSVLFVGNSHTHARDIPQKVSDLVRWLRPDQTVATGRLQVRHLDVAAEHGQFANLMSAHSWNAVVLQAQQISTSGRFHYSTADGIEMARQAAAQGASVHFFAEWGLQGQAGSAQRTDAIYREMAAESATAVIPVGLAWQAVLDEQPDLPLYDADGNHQTNLGAELTALTIATYLLGESPLSFLDYTPTTATPDQWRLFCHTLHSTLTKKDRHF